MVLKNISSIIKGIVLIEWSHGTKEYRFDNKLHRINGPAIEYSNGTKEYYYDDMQMTVKEYNTIMYYYNLYQVIIRELNY